MWFKDENKSMTKIEPKQEQLKDIHALLPKMATMSCDSSYIGKKGTKTHDRIKRQVKMGKTQKMKKMLKQMKHRPSSKRHKKGSEKAKKARKKERLFCPSKTEFLSALVKWI